MLVLAVIVSKPPLASRSVGVPPPPDVTVPVTVKVAAA